MLYDRSIDPHNVSRSQISVTQLARPKQGPISGLEMAPEIVRGSIMLALAANQFSNERMTTQLRLGDVGCQSSLGKNMLLDVWKSQTELVVTAIS